MVQSTNKDSLVSKEKVSPTESLAVYTHHLFETLNLKAQEFNKNSIVSPTLHYTYLNSSRSLSPRGLRDRFSRSLSIESLLEMYTKNSLKTRDPNIQFTYAQVLIRSYVTLDINSIEDLKTTKVYLQEAEEALKRSSRGGCIEAQYLLGDLYSVGLFGKPDLQSSLFFFEIAGKSKHAESAYRAALCYKNGWGCFPDSRKVIRYFEIAALNNHPIAMMELGRYCFHGLMGMPDDNSTKRLGISWLKRATEVASDLSCSSPYELGLIFLNGFKDIVIKDTAYAIKLFFKAANLGHSKSASLLGRIYETGEIVEFNPELSIHFYNMAAELGDPEGMMGLSSWYFVGSQNLDQDEDEAFAWAFKAAELGSIKGMRSLARYYERGVGCTPNRKKCAFWNEKAKACEVSLE
ncbi:hypothetical protein CANARDRAFT_200100 [[Candida] arabinofermentans NRRL YB-2248]|uniref:HCP-like protein n=1 Tax=[Candida] arabinofermentans NRRL YB-2248 TaxID=983967 RepID=A0A1E4SZ11_9ASCO|nr:hypothetical protein CANARDRAFT_200100 [[Candida] arabinofermentans NRRL YB-2248]